MRLTKEQKCELLPPASLGSQVNGKAEISNYQRRKRLAAATIHAMLSGHQLFSRGREMPREFPTGRGSEWQDR